jgi:hypothetical protein
MKAGAGQKSGSGESLPRKRLCLPSPCHWLLACEPSAAQCWAILEQRIGLLDGSLQVVVLTALAALVREVTAAECGAHVCVGNTVRERVDGVGEVDACAISAVDGVIPERINRLQS